ncbi:MAG: IS1634 family transposase [Thermoanaerobaculaceae bacterium]|jgi:hypothetical protein|nr:IS1634 family transposase [Thermoanaerobaculaceae bacterium]
MHLDSSTVRVKGKSYTRHLLRESFRVDGKVKHRTIANLSSCSPQEIEAIRLALRHKGDLASLVKARESIELRQGPSCGAVWVIHSIARELGIVRALGCTRQGKLALWQVIARVLDQGSRLSAVRLASGHAACDILALDSFNEDDLYSNLDWLDHNQRRIEDRLWQRTTNADEPGLYLYDVTSSYLEGTQNELAAFGYNRDGKKGKRQIVIGLLCNARGVPVSIEVFLGNTQDPKTVASQVHKIAKRFGGRAVTLVGDRGMIKGPQIEALPADFYYITAITKVQIETLLSSGTLQMCLFDEKVSEVIAGDGVRYILRRNAARAEDIARARKDKLAAVERTAASQTTYLAEHPRASVARALHMVTARAERLKIAGWATVTEDGRQLRVTVDQNALTEAAKLDGCYVIKSNLPTATADATTVHDRYRDLALVERFFRTSKTIELEMRPVFVRLASHTRGHTLVVMLAYCIVRELARRWANLDLTVEEALTNHLNLITTQHVVVEGSPAYQKIPQPSETNRQLLAAANVTLPAALPDRGVTVATRKKLPTRRKSR